MRNNNNILLINLYLGILTDSFQSIIPKLYLVLVYVTILWHVGFFMHHINHVAHN